MHIIQIDKLGNGKRRIHFDEGDNLILYYSETRGCELEEGSFISYEIYEHLLREVVGKRAKKRALHLLEQMDRTEQQLREKLMDYLIENNGENKITGEDGVLKRLFKGKKK